MKQFKIHVYTNDGTKLYEFHEDETRKALDLAKRYSATKCTCVVWSTNLMKIYHVYINGIQVSGSY